MQSREHGCRASATQRKAQKVQVGMNNIESPGFHSEGLLLHQDQRCITIHRPSLRPECLRARCLESGPCSRIPTCKESDVMPLADQFLCEIEDDPLRASV